MARGYICPAHREIAEEFPEYAIRLMTGYSIHSPIRVEIIYCGPGLLGRWRRWARRGPVVARGSDQNEYEVAFRKALHAMLRANEWGRP